MMLGSGDIDERESEVRMKMVRFDEGECRQGFPIVSDSRL